MMQDSTSACATPIKLEDWPVPGLHDRDATPLGPGRSSYLIKQKTRHGIKQSGYQCVEHSSATTAFVHHAHNGLKCSGFILKNKLFDSPLLLETTTQGLKLDPGNVHKEFLILHEIKGDDVASTNPPEKLRTLQFMNKMSADMLNKGIS